MISKSRFSLITATVLMVFAFSAMWTVPALADDSTPPPAEPPAEVTPEAEPETAETPAAETETAPAEPVVVTEEAAPAEGEDVSSEESTELIEVLEQLPEGTSVQVVDEGGETIPLATQEAADAVATSDPIWCPATVATPVNNASGCSPSYTSFSDLLVWLQANNPSKAGIIWIEKSYDSSTAIGTVTDVGVTEFVLDGDTGLLDSMANYALTIRGGWNGIGTKTVDTNDPSVFQGASLSILNWKGIITISDILIDGATSTTSGTGDTYALLVETDKNIQLDRVTVKNSLNTGGDSMTGAKLNNNNSIISSTVIVNNGIFQDNEGDGLVVQSAGVVTITSLYADGNDVRGAVIDNTFNPSLTAPDKAVTLKGALEFNNNGDAGLSVYSKGLITISNVNATENGDNGVNLDNRNSLTSQGVTINGTNNFISNAIGLNVLTRGVVTTNNLNASANGGDGVYIDNCDITLPTGYCLGLIAKTVKLNGYNYFNNNGDNGLQIHSFGGITVYNLTASDNTDSGAILDNRKINNALPVQKEGIGTISLLGYGIFNNNGGDGLNALSYDNISLTNLTANQNGSNGVEVYVEKVTPTVKKVGKKNVTYTTANLTVTGVNYFTGNDFDGLNVLADGSISLSSINANFNGEDGAELATFTLGYGVTLTGTNTFMQNGVTGLDVDSAGVITLSNVTSLYNQVGASLKNIAHAGTVTPYVPANPSTPSKPYSVTLTGTNAFNFNNEDGLIVNSYGSITINNLNANGNGQIASAGSGATLDNCIESGGLCTTITAAAVNLTGYVIANDNDEKGVEIDSLGAVTVNNATASGNENVGLHIENKYKPSLSAAARGVTLKGTNTFNGNLSSGLFIRSYGAISLNNINANYNGDTTSASASGAYLDNSFDRTPGNPAGEASVVARNITITGVNSFIGNYRYGLTFFSNGLVSLTRINANGNDWDASDGLVGAGVNGVAKSITISCVHMFGNGAGPGVHDAAVGYNLQVGLPVAGAAPAVNGVLTIKGLYSAGNNGTDVATVPAGSTVVTTQSCALP